jgi:hypothetical protein
MMKKTRTWIAATVAMAAELSAGSAYADTCFRGAPPGPPAAMRVYLVRPRAIKAGFVRNAEPSARLTTFASSSP